MNQMFYFLIFSLLIKSQRAYTDRVDINSSKDPFFVVRAISSTLVLIFHKEYTIIRTINETSNIINKISNTPFLFSGTFYPLVYTENNLLYYIVSPDSTISPSKFQIYYNTDFRSNKCIISNADGDNCIKQNPFGGFTFSKLTSLNPINNHQFIASYLNLANQCEVAIFDINTDQYQLLDNSLLQQCPSESNKSLNVYKLGTEYIFIKSSTGKIESGTFINSNVKASNIEITLDNGCENVSQLQIIEMGNNKYMNCFIDSTSSNVCCANATFDNGEYILGTFKSDIQCSDSQYFSMNMLTNNLLMIGCSGGKNIEYNYILYSDDRRLRQNGKIGNTEHVIKDFVILPNQNFYSLKFHGSCGSIHEKEDDKSEIPSDWKCFDKSINVEVQNTNDYINMQQYLNDQDPNSIYINNNDCSSNLKDNSKNILNYKNSYVFQTLFISQKYNIDCSIKYYSAQFTQSAIFGTSFNVYCYLDLRSCDYSCLSCDQISKSQNEMNCNFCKTDYLLKQYPNSILGNCCKDNISYCVEYNTNCGCANCIPGFDLQTSKCGIRVEDIIIKMNSTQKELIKLHEYSLPNGVKIEISKIDVFEGIISTKNSETNSYVDISTNIIESNEIQYTATKKGEYSFTYYIKDSDILSNVATVKIFVCKYGCKCEMNNLNKYECLDCDDDYICQDIKVKDFVQIVNLKENDIIFTGKITPDEGISLNDKEIFIDLINPINGHFEVNGMEKETDFYTEKQIINYIKNQTNKDGGTYYFNYNIVNSLKEQQSNTGRVTLIVCDNNCICDSSNYCTDCLPNYYYYVDSSGKLNCLDKCQPELRLIENTFICKDKPICPNIAYELNEKEDACILKEIEKLIGLMNDINIIIADLNQKLEDDKYILEVYYTDKPFDKNSSVSDIDFSQCEKILKEKGIIKESDSLIIAKVDFLKANTTTREVQYQVYTNDGEIVNLDYCKNINIEITYPIDDGSDINYDLAKEMSKDNIDIYNINDPFFNDLCFPYSLNGKDITLEDRKKYLYQNINVCKDNCMYKKMNYMSDTVSCDCDLSSSNFNLKNINTEKNKFNVKNLFGKSLGALNLKISKCLNLFLKFKDLRYNIGFIFGSCINITEIIMIIILIFYGYDTINSKIHNIIQKNEIDDKLINVRENNQFMFMKECMTQDSKEYLANNLPKYRAKSSLQVIEKKIFYENLPYNFAVRKDKRNFCKIFKHNFIEKYPITRALTKLSYFELINLNVIVYLTHLEIMFSIDGILYSIPQISKDFHGKLKFSVSLLYSFISFLLGILILRFLKYIVFFSPILETLIYEMKNNKLLLKLTMNYLKFIKMKIFFFLIINFFVAIFFWYYMTIFCIIYRYSQVKWFIRGWISFFYSFLHCLIFSFIFTLFRHLSFDLKNRNLYNLSLFIRKLF